MWLILASALIAVIMTAVFRVRVDPTGTYALEWLIAALLLASRIWWDRTDHQRMADACGTVGTVGSNLSAFFTQQVNSCFKITV